MRGSGVANCHFVTREIRGERTFSFAHVITPVDTLVDSTEIPNSYHVKNTHAVLDIPSCNLWAK
jgi:hypothetical protein